MGDVMADGSKNFVHEEPVDLEHVSVAEVDANAGKNVRRCREHGREVDERCIYAIGDGQLLDCTES